MLSNSAEILKQKKKLLNQSWGQNVLVVFSNAFKIGFLVGKVAMMAKLAFSLQNLNFQDLESFWKNKQRLSNHPLKFQCLKGVQKHSVAYKTYSVREY